MFYAIDAVDTLFFRNASPFDAGLNYNSSSMFPPLPSVYAGALRNIAYKREDENQSISSRQLKIGFNGLMVNHRFLFPRPLDSVVVDDHNSMELLHLTPAPVGSGPLESCLSTPSSGETSLQKEVEPRGGGYIEESELQVYLDGGSFTSPCKPLADFVHIEDHIGIQIDRKSGASLSRKWYSVQRVRPINTEKRKCMLVVEAKGVTLDKQALLKIGGESKVGSLKPLKQECFFTPATSTDKFFKLYLATPAIFKQGWLPWWIDPVTKEGSFAYKKHRIRVRLISAAVGKYVPTGGFGTVSGKAKPRELRLAVPAGSVYFFKILEGTFEDANKLFHQKCISDYRENLGFVYNNWDRLRYCDRGFGYSFVGRIGKEQGGMVTCTN
ncbi:type III-B CRISPR module-associated Cmr3 family protein [Paenibacillus faecalis]|uniref:type III-B CRISPR module-associated Cmr3 family protein n=1 Tax=Paenibacillus faecalis TaxID=2079532 RepID=UPI000D1141CB|nr:type III-B CRISPR module-associated Cmr3 family protein [Paenibacillus faecalis]